MRHLRVALRERATEAERILWEELRGRRLCGCKFRRQHSLDGIVFDFYAAELRIDIEIDGGVHDQPAISDYDASRDATAARYGITVLRFTNTEVLYALPSVLARIANVIDARISELGSNPRPPERTRSPRRSTKRSR